MKEYNTIQLLEKLKENKREISAIVCDIARMKKDYEKSIISLKEEYNSLIEESCVIGGNVVFFRVGDLLDEICWLSETNVEDLVVSLESNIPLLGKYNKDDFFEYLTYNEENGMNFRLSGVNASGYSFNYVIYLSMDFDSIQADANTLWEHCSVVTRRNHIDKVYTKLVVENIESIILGVNLNLLCLDTNAMWYHADLFTQAVLNCEEKYNQSSNTILKRTR